MSQTPFLWLDTATVAAGAPLRESERRDDMLHCFVCVGGSSGKWFLLGPVRCIKIVWSVASLDVVLTDIYIYLMLIVWSVASLDVVLTIYLMLGLFSGFTRCGAHQILDY